MPSVLVYLRMAFLCQLFPSLIFPIFSSFSSFSLPFLLSLSPLLLTPSCSFPSTSYNPLFHWVYLILGLTVNHLVESTWHWTQLVSQCHRNCWMANNSLDQWMYLPLLILHWMKRETRVSSFLGMAAWILILYGTQWKPCDVIEAAFSWASSCLSGGRGTWQTHFVYDQVINSILFKVKSLLLLQYMVNCSVDSGPAGWSTTPVADDSRRKPFFTRKSGERGMRNSRVLVSLNSSTRMIPLFRYESPFFLQRNHLFCNHS